MNELPRLMNYRCPNRCDVCGPDCYAAQEREQRMPPGTQIVIAVLAGLVVCMIGAMLWPARWWPW